MNNYQLEIGKDRAEWVLDLGIGYGNLEMGNWICEVGYGQWDSGKLEKMGPWVRSEGRKHSFLFSAVTANWG